MSPGALIISTFTGCLVGGVVPFVNTELLLLSAAAVAPEGVALPLVVAATCGQMISKVALYLAARGTLRLPHASSEKVQRVLARMHLSGDNVSGMLLFASASVGVPSFYMTTIASGAVRVSLVRFVVLGSCGRALRFAAVLLIPLLLRRAM